MLIQLLIGVERGLRGSQVSRRKALTERLKSLL
jgi:hypothetical protein